MKINVTFS